MKSFRCILWIVLLVSSQAYAQYDALQKKLTTYIDKELPQASVGISLRDAETGQEVIDIDAHKLLTPASTMKVITVFTAYDILGGDHTFTTEVGIKGEVENEILSGDLVIIGGGDPTFLSSRGEDVNALDLWIEQLEHTLEYHGIYCVTGDIVVDVSRYTGQDTPAKWPYEDLGNYYGAAAYALNFNENMVKVFFENQPADKALTHIRSIEPYLPHLYYDNQVRTSHKNGKDEAYIFGAENQYSRYITGTIPSRKNNFSIKGSMPYPPRDFGYMLKDRLPELFPASDIVVSRKRVKGIKVITDYKSSNVQSIGLTAMHKSVNLYCEALLREMAFNRFGTGSITDGLDLLYRRNGLERKNMSMKVYDGSGLTPSNLITPAYLTKFIGESLKKHPPLESFLPLVGQEGTVKNMLKGSMAERHFRLKSGYMDRVLAYAGIGFKNNRGHTIAIMINNSNLSYGDQKKKIEFILEEIYKTF